MPPAPLHTVPAPRSHGAPRCATAAVLALLALVATACTLVPAPVPPTGGEPATTIAIPAGHGFGGGTVYHPAGATEPMGAVVIVPGFTADQSSVAWYGPLLAEAGFVALTIDTNSIFDQPGSRRDQALAALDHLATDPAVADLVDPDRQAVVGWSMGGGGSLEAALARPGLRAIVPLAPWDTTTDFAAVVVPTLVVACEDDAIAPVADHARPMYESIPSATPKAFLELAGAAHDCVTTPDDDVATAVVSWLDHFVDGDPVAVCPRPSTSPTISASTSSCPF